MIEWIAIAAILAVFIFSLWRAHLARVAQDNVDSKESALAIWRGRAQTLAGSTDIDPQEREREMERLRAGVLADAGGQTRASQLGPRGMGLLVSIALICVTALVGYQQHGGLLAVQRTQDNQLLQQSLDQADSLAAAIAVMQAGIERHALPERYYSLGQLLEQNGELGQAYQAYRNARERAELDQLYAEALPEFMAAEAQALLFSDAEQVTAAATLAGRALGLDENNTMALGVLGVASFEQRNFADAERYWSRLLTLLPPQSPDYQAVAQGLQIARSAQGIAGPSVRLNIPRPSIDVAPGTPVFVYARISEDEPTPMVVARVDFSELPTELVLTNEMRMGPMAGLPTQGAVEIVARVSLSGGVAPAPGDWQGVARSVSTEQGEAILVIDQQL